MCIYDVCVTGNSFQTVSGCRVCSVVMQSVLKVFMPFILQVSLKITLFIKASKLQKQNYRCCFFKFPTVHIMCEGSKTNMCSFGEGPKNKDKVTPLPLIHKEQSLKPNKPSSSSTCQLFPELSTVSHSYTRHT